MEIMNNFGLLLLGLCGCVGSKGVTANPAEVCELVEAPQRTPGDAAADLVYCGEDFSSLPDDPNCDDIPTAWWTYEEVMAGCRRCPGGAQCGPEYSSCRVADGVEILVIYVCYDRPTL